MTSTDQVPSAPPESLFPPPRQSWRARAIASQQLMCEQFGGVDWDLYCQNETHLLQEKVMLLLFGPDSNGRSRDEYSLVKKICDVITREGLRHLVLPDGREEGGTLMMFVFVYLLAKNGDLQVVPVFRVAKNETGTQYSFIDISGRVYKNWGDFLENNLLPPCQYCYPRGGVYSVFHNGNVIVDFGKTPASKQSKKVLECLDKASSGLAIGTTALSLASLMIPVAGPLLSASLLATGGISAYNTVRSSVALYDRSKHGQSIGLKDGDARSCWLSIGGSVIGAAACGATTATIKLAETGRTVGRIGTSAMTALNASSFIVNGAGMVNNLCHLVEKFKEGDLTTLDVAQFSGSLLLLCHATVNLATARSIIENAQSEAATKSSVLRRISEKFVRKPDTAKMGERPMSVRSVRHINNVSDIAQSVCILERPNGSIVPGGGISVLSTLATSLQSREIQALLTHLGEALKSMVLRVSEAVFNFMREMHCSEEFPEIVRFVGEFVSNALRVPLRELRLFLLDFVSGARRNIPITQMPGEQLCLAVLEEFLQDPGKIVHIYECIQHFCVVLLEVTSIPWGLSKSSVLALIPASQVLMQTESPLWERIIEFGLQLFRQLGLRKPATLIIIIREVCDYIKSIVMEMQRREEMLGGAASNDTETSEERRHYYSTAVESLNDERVHEAVVAQIVNNVVENDDDDDDDGLLPSDETPYDTNPAQDESNSNGSVVECTDVDGVQIIIDNDTSPSHSEAHSDGNGEQYYSGGDGVHQEPIVDLTVDDFEGNETTTSHGIPLFLYTVENPLVINRSFWDRDGSLSTLTEGEILQICMEVLSVELTAEDCFYEYSGLAVFVHMLDKMVVIQSDIDSERIYAYVDSDAIF